MCAPENPGCGCEGEKVPFKSEKQKKFMFANHPQMAKKWASEKGDTRKQALGRRLTRKKT